MKKISIFFVCIITALISFKLYCHALSAQSAVVIDADSGRVLYSHNSNQKMGMASTTKIMTAITALENGDVNSIATVSPNAYGVEGSSMYLNLGEKLSLENLLYGLMLASGNDAATAVAEHISGSVEKFSVLMNQTATKIGATSSNFTNPHGLSDENHYTTSHDLAKITAYALKNAKFQEIVSSKTKNIPWENHDYDRHLVNHNKFLSMYEGCIGVKTGFTKATGRCLVTAVEKNGLTLVCVTLNAPDDWNDHKTLYDKTFAEYSPKKIKTVGEILTSVNIKNGAVDKIDLTINKDIILPLTDTEQNELKVQILPFEDLQAPISKGDVLGKILIETKDSFCVEYPLVAATDADKKKLLAPPPAPGFSHYLKKVFSLWLSCFE